MLNRVAVFMKQMASKSACNVCRPSIEAPDSVQNSKAGFSLPCRSVIFVLVCVFTMPLSKNGTLMYVTRHSYSIL